MHCLWFNVYDVIRRTNINRLFNILWQFLNESYHNVNIQGLLNLFIAIKHVILSNCKYYMHWFKTPFCTQHSVGNYFIHPCIKTFRGICFKKFFWLLIKVTDKTLTSYIYYVNASFHGMFMLYQCEHTSFYIHTF